MQKSKLILLVFISSLFSTPVLSQDQHYEVGLELGNVNFSNFGGSVQFALKGALVEDDEFAYGAIARMRYFRFTNQVQGVEGSTSFFGLGGFFHYRFMDWFYLGSEVEFNQNPFRNIEPDNKWHLAGFIGGGIQRDLIEDGLSINAGVMFDLFDAIRIRTPADQASKNPSNFHQYYLRQNSPQGGIPRPVIYRITFFLPINK